MRHLLVQQAEIAPGQMKAFQAGAKRIVLFRHLDGTFSALEDRCSHADVRLSGGKFSGSEVECPAHGARFDVCSGKPLCMPAVSPVKTFAVESTAEGVFVTLP